MEPDLMEEAKQFEQHYKGKDGNRARGEAKFTIKAENLRLEMELMNELVGADTRAVLNQDGLYALCMSQSDVAIQYIHIPTQNMVQLTNLTTDIMFHLPLNTLMNLLKEAKVDENLTIKIDTNEQLMEITNEEIDFTQTINLMEPNKMRQMPQIPDIEYTDKITIDGEKLYRYFKITKNYRDYIRFKATENEYKLSCKEDQPTKNLVLRASGRGDKEAHGIYALDYLKTPVNSTRKKDLPDNFTAHLGEDKPIALTRTNAKALTMIAPRIE